MSKKFKKWRKPELIKTKRFLLKPLQPKHATQKYLNWLKDSISSRYIAAAKKTKKITDLKNYIKKFSGHKKCIFLRILTKKTNTHIGNIKFEPIDLKKKTAVMGILVGEPSWRGKGVAAEVIKATSRSLRANLGINKIFLGVSKKNKRALKAYKKLGFKWMPIITARKHKRKNQLFMIKKIGNFK